MRDKNYLKHIRSIPCLLCTNEAEPHHLMRTGTRGMGLKSGDEFVVPICRVHHAQVTETGNEEEFWLAHGWTYEQVLMRAQGLYNAYLLRQS